MENLLQDKIEDYVAGMMPEQEKLSFEAKIKEQESLRQQVIETQKLREVLLRNRVRTRVNAARTEINKAPKRGLMFTFGTFAAAASIIFFMLSMPISLSKHEFNYRGEIGPLNQDTQARANDFKKAQEIVENGEKPSEAIAILEQLSENPAISQNYQRNAKWLLVIAYLQANEAIKAETVFNKIQCEGIECPFTFWEKTKIQWQIFWGKL